MVNFEPLFKLLSTSINPLWFSIILKQIESPSPTPLSLVVKKGSNILS
jgi:hypothetical protein